MHVAFRAVTLFAALAGAPAALAHAHLGHASPAVGSMVHGTPHHVELAFTSNLEPIFSNVKVLDRNGKQVDMKDKAVDEKDHSVIRVSVSALVPGVYRVVWKAVSIDAHTTEGEFTFEVAP